MSARIAVRCGRDTLWSENLGGTQVLRLIVASQQRPVFRVEGMIGRARALHLRAIAKGGGQLVAAVPSGTF